MASNSSEETLPKIAKANALVASFKPVAYKEFDFHLISVGKLTKDMDCCVFFFAGYCEIQTGMSRKTIVYAKKRQGLYHFREIKEELSSATAQPATPHFSHSSSPPQTTVHQPPSEFGVPTPYSAVQHTSSETPVTAIHLRQALDQYSVPLPVGSGFVDDHLCKSFSQLVSGDEAQVTSSGVEPGLSSGHMDYGFNEDRDSIGEVSLVLVEQSSVDRTILLQPSPSAQHDISDNESQQGVSENAQPTLHHSSVSQAPQCQRGVDGKYTSFAL
nr:uncharacterized protein LOC109163333 [Ipomoea trifida]